MTRRMVCVGGSLHGRVVEIDADVPALVVTVGPVDVEMVPAPELGSEVRVLRFTERLEVYRAKRVHGLLVLVHDAGGSWLPSVEVCTVEALRIAAGLESC